MERLEGKCHCGGGVEPCICHLFNGNRQSGGVRYVTCSDMSTTASEYDTLLEDIASTDTVQSVFLHPSPLFPSFFLLGQTGTVYAM